MATTLKAKLTGLFAIACITLSCVSCSGPSETGCFRPINASGWNYGDTVNFELAPTDTASIGKLAVAVRHTANYDYSNLWLELSYCATDSIAPDTLNIQLADSHGNWYGKGLGLSYQHIDTVKYDFELKDTVTIGVRHIMRSDQLKEIEQIGLIFEPEQ